MLSRGRSKQLNENISNVVLVEDNDSNRDAISKALEKIGFSVRAFGLGEPAISYLESVESPVVIVSDIRLPDTSGVELLKKAKELNKKHSIILITGYGSIEDAVDAMKLGADDYLTKPLDLFKLRKQVESFINRQKLQEEVTHLKERLDKRFGMENIIGKSSAMERIFEQVRLVAPTSSTVLITGESGTGKELIANAIHQLSPRKDNRFLPLNCAAIAPNLLESELFGHEKGSFTGADQKRAGKFELAHNGTIFLDEISEISLDVQVKLLRVLESKEIMRVGGSNILKVDCRVIAATNRDLEKMVDDKAFREDLYYRLKVIKITIPPLSERKEDIPLLVNHYLSYFIDIHSKPPLNISAELMDFFMQYNWKGNVREIKNLIESMVIFAADKTLSMENLPSEYQKSNDISENGINFDSMTMSEIEKKAILNALEKTNSNKTQAAKILGIGLRTLQRKIKEYEENN
jgi:DNA-binding NtrC family response regulator